MVLFKSVSEFVDISKLSRAPPVKVKERILGSR